MGYIDELKKRGAAIVITDGALDKPVPLADKRVVMLSELRKGDRFHEFLGSSSLPLRTAKTDAYIADLDEDGDKVWAVGLEPLTEAEKKRWGKGGCFLRSS
jgi:hypothetical protein